MLSLALRLARAVSFILLGLALLWPWYRVPIGLRPGAQNSYAVVFLEPHSTLAFKILVAASLVSILVYCSRRSVTAIKRLIFVSGIGLFLFVLLATSFAPLTMQRCARVAAQAEWLTDQNFSLILPTGDSLNEEEYSYQSFEPLVSITDVMPRSFQVLPAPEFTNLLDLHLTQLPEISLWLGYTSGFCQFVKRGWFCGLFGAILLFASFSRSVRIDLGPTKVLAWRFFVIALIGGTALEGFWLAFPFAAGIELHRARLDAGQGGFEGARIHLDRAFGLLPSLHSGTDILFEEGWLDRRIGQTTSTTSRLVQAVEEEEEHLSARAWTHYEQLMQTENPGEVRAEAFRGALRLALRDLNSGLEERAAARLNELSALDPSCIKANYALQLADLRLHRKAALERDVLQFETVYKTFQSLEKIAPIASAHKRLAELDFETNDAADVGEQLRAAAKE